MELERRKEAGNPLFQVLHCMLNMLIRKTRHRIITMIVVWLVADIHALHTRLFGRLCEVLGEELALFVEVVAGSLYQHISKTLRSPSDGNNSKLLKGKGRNVQHQ